MRTHIVYCSKNALRPINTTDNSAFCTAQAHKNVFVGTALEMKSNYSFDNKSAKHGGSSNAMYPLGLPHDFFFLLPCVAAITDTPHQFLSPAMQKPNMTRATCHRTSSAFFKAQSKVACASNEINFFAVNC